MHYFPGLDEEKILWHTSYTNLSMYLATIPSYDSEDEKEKVPSRHLTKDENIIDKELSKAFACFK